MNNKFVKSKKVKYLQKNNSYQQPSNNLSYIAYYFSLMFILPILFVMVFDVNLYMGIFVVCFTLLFFIYALFFKRDIFFNPEKLSLSTTSIKVFFVAQLISIMYSVISRFYAFDVSGIDGSIFDGLIQEMLLGKFGYTPIIGMYHFATHQNYVLMLLAPFYAIFNSQVFLQIICGLSFWLSGIVLWKISRIYFGQIVSILLLVCFFTLPSNEFHMFQPEVFYPLAICLMYYSLYCCKPITVSHRIIDPSWLWLMLSTGFLLSIKEDGAWFGLGFALFLMDLRIYVC